MYLKGVLMAIPERHVQQKVVRLLHGTQRKNLSIDLEKRVKLVLIPTPHLLPLNQNWVSSATEKRKAWFSFVPVLTGLIWYLLLILEHYRWTPICLTDFSQKSYLVASWPWQTDADLQCHPFQGTRRGKAGKCGGVLWISWIYYFHHEKGEGDKEAAKIVLIRNVPARLSLILEFSPNFFRLKTHISRWTDIAGMANCWVISRVPPGITRMWCLPMEKMPEAGLLRQLECCLHTSCLSCADT